MKKAIVSMFFFLLFISANASHLVGGVMSYQYVVSINSGATIKYELTVKMYRSGIPSTNANFDQEFDIGVFNSNKLYNTCTVKLQSQQTGSYCYEEAVYSASVDLDSGKEYAFIYERCCLTQFMNIQYDQGFSLYAYMQNSSNKSNSPTMDKPLVNYIWSKKGTQTLDLHATDIDSDFLQYEIVKPLLGGDQNNPKPAIPGTIASMFPPYSINTGNLVYVTGYTNLAPFGSFASLTLDSNTGIATIQNPKYTNGRFYWCTKISEYRNNILIGLIYVPVCSEFNPQHNTSCTDALNEVIARDLIKISPNPFQTQITIDNLNPKVNKIEMYDMSGKLQEVVKISAQNQIVLNFPHLQNGLYLLRFIDTNGNIIASQKVVKSN